MNKELLSKLFNISIFGLAFAGIIFIGLAFFVESNKSPNFMIAIFCIGLSNMFTIIKTLVI